MLTLVNISTIDLNLIPVLHAVLEEGGVVGAARRLHVTPSAVSNALTRLRALLGDPLFVRRGRGLVATPRALELAPRIGAALAELEGALLGGPTFDPARTQRSFALVLPDGEQSALLPRIAPAFRARMPQARLEIVSLDTLVARGGLASEVADVAIGLVPPEPDIFATALYEDGVALLVARDHPRIKGRRVSPERLRAERHIDTHLVLGRPGLGHRAGSAALATAGLERDVAVVVPTFTAAAMVAAHTELVATVPRRAAEALSKLVPVRVLAGPTELRFTISLVWHARTHEDAGARAFRALLLEVLKPRTRA